MADDEETLLASGAAARLAGVHPVALRRMHAEGSGPAYFRFGSQGKRRYRPADVLRWKAKTKPLSGRSLAAGGAPSGQDTT